MNLKQIQQEIAKLSPDDLARFREWFKKYESKVTTDVVNDSKTPIEEILKRSRGSLKGKGILKALMEERRRESRQ